MVVSLKVFVIGASAGGEKAIAIALKSLEKMEDAVFFWSWFKDF